MSQIKKAKAELKRQTIANDILTYLTIKYREFNTTLKSAEAGREAIKATNEYIKKLYISDPQNKTLIISAGRRVNEFLKEEVEKIKTEIG